MAVQKKGNGLIVKSDSQYMDFIRSANENLKIGLIDSAVDDFLNAARNRKDAGLKEEMTVVANKAYDLMMSKAEKDRSGPSAAKAREIAEEFVLGESKEKKARAYAITYYWNKAREAHREKDLELTVRYAESALDLSDGKMFEEAARFLAECYTDLADMAKIKENEFVNRIKAAEILGKYVGKLEAQEEAIKAYAIRIGEGDTYGSIAVVKKYGLSEVFDDSKRTMNHDSEVNKGRIDRSLKDLEESLRT